jgi:hypothetical protein
MELKFDGRQAINIIGTTTLLKCKANQKNRLGLLICDSRGDRVNSNWLTGDKLLRLISTSLMPSGSTSSSSSSSSSSQQPSGTLPTVSVILSEPQFANQYQCVLEYEVHNGGEYELRVWVGGSLLPGCPISISATGNLQVGLTIFSNVMVHSCFHKLHTSTNVLV